MHRALTTVEVVEMICAQLSDPQGGLYNLSRLARTSTVFLHPALNVLWNHQGTLLNLLRCMPLDLWHITETQAYEDDENSPLSMNLKIALRRPIGVADWDRFLFYSHRAKSFSVDQQGELETQEVHEVLGSCFPEESIFPNLQKLDWFALNHNSFLHLRLFLAPRITNLDISIRHISIGSPGVFEVASAPHMSTFIRGLRHVESLTVARLDCAVFSHVAQLPRHHSLWLMASTTRSSLRLNAFPFRLLQPSSPSPSSTPLHSSRILGKVPYASIHSSQGAVAFRPPRTQLGNSIRHWYPIAQSSLQILTVKGGYWAASAITTDQRDIYSIGGEIMRPLCRFSSPIRLSPSHLFDLDDVVARDMARAWPRIEALSLSPENSHRIPEGLYALANHCPRLRNLHIAFHATIVPNIKVDGTNRILHCSLQRLDVAHSAIGKPRPVAKFLSTIFPQLETIDTLYEHIPRTRSDFQLAAAHKRWKKIEAALC
ncbi:hypothetical protein DFH09DRAFT_1284445 [Mycena vulgaris]|nr:hypothetical protein DFH09DRAFT_1284445 [Mycena vulgaris]